jgi:hypothetical protein
MRSLDSVTSGSANTSIGNQSMQTAGAGSAENTVIGAQAGL